MRAFPIMRSLGYPVVYDVTHSLQLPGGGDGVTAGQAEFIEPMACAGVAAGVDGVFMEVHEQPARAKSDAQNALKLDLLPALLDKLVQIHAIRTTPAARKRPMTAGHRDGARPRAQGPAHRGGGDPRPGRSARRRLRARPAAALRVPRPRDRHRHGQVRHHLPEDRGDAVEHRHVRRSSCTRPKPSTATSARSGTTTWSSRSRTAARPRN